MKKAYLGLGSNMGDKKRYLYEAIQMLNHHDQVGITQLSSLYETAPWGYVDQDIFMNLVVEIETALEPLELLNLCQQIENELGRIRKFKWGPRVIDVDILLYDGEVIECERLIVPHPYMTERDFVMIPLSEINPQLMINGQKVQELAQQFNLEALKMVSKKL
ncbi:MAG: 2-amino-4-hydroxy-6-hydroxymethyldihydropteridine diphosphokinase [Turicibacter sp.]|nr:2-amino-4-hydroxy-6-hydroxymethyldihydropteridine diphosphokinase [Turicibacter sp.]